MTNTSTHHAFCFTLFTLVALAFGVAFTSSLASKPVLRDSHAGPSETVFAHDQEQANPAKTRSPSVTPPCPAGSAPIQVAL
jgi:hypothetical protein